MNLYKQCASLYKAHYDKNAESSKYANAHYGDDQEYIHNICNSCPMYVIFSLRTQAQTHIQYNNVHA